jgi:ankyrin repeat protein
MWAAGCGSLSVVEAILKVGADVDATNDRVGTGAVWTAQLDMDVVLSVS